MSLLDRGVTASRLRHLLVATALLLLPVQVLAVPALFYSDLDSGPNSGGQNDKGVFVTVWGRGLGNSQGNGNVTVGGVPADNYPLWSDTKIVFQLAENAKSGNIVVKASNGENSNGIPFTVRSGRIFFVSPNGSGSGSITRPMSPSAVYNSIRPGDIFYLRAGSYSGSYGGSWGARNFAFGRIQSGRADKPVAFVGYPNEVAVLVAADLNSGSNIVLRNNGGDTDLAHYMTFANLTFVGGGSCVSGGGWWKTEGSGATHGRLVGNVFSARYCNSCNTMTGLISIDVAGWRVFGNEFKDTGGNPPINNNHAVYVNTGADDVEIGWNYFHDLRMGHVIQVHTDIAYLYEDIRIHDNLLTAANVNDSRGINVGRTLPGSYGVIYNNVLSNLGQDFSAIVMYSGTWKLFNNTLHNIHATATRSSAAIWIGGMATAEVRNNIIHVNSLSQYIAAYSGASTSQLSLSNNLYFGNGPGPGQDQDLAGINADPLFVNPNAGDFHLQSGSPAVDGGHSAVGTVVTVDRDGVGRPRGAGFDIGAYEFR